MIIRVVVFMVVTAYHCSAQRPIRLRLAHRTKILSLFILVNQHIMGQWANFTLA